MRKKGYLILPEEGQSIKEKIDHFNGDLLRAKKMSWIILAGPQKEKSDFRSMSCPRSSSLTQYLSF